MTPSAPPAPQPGHRPDDDRRRSGQQRRIEIFLHDDDGRLFITGMPRADRTRDWIYNIAADPSVVVHLKQSVVADIPATARVITDPDERLPLIEVAAKRWGRTDVANMLQHSPLIVLSVDGDGSPSGTGNILNPRPDAGAGRAGQTPDHDLLGIRSGRPRVRPADAG